MKTRKNNIVVVKGGKTVKTVSVADLTAAEKQRFYLTMVSQYSKLGYQVNWA